MMLTVDKGRCCGCSACMSVCPKKAISMQPDKEGFLYPSIDEAKCIQCGLCERVCFYSDDTKKMAYAARVRDMSARMDSQSGGMFFAMAKHCIEAGGVVYGCGMDEKWHAVHKRAVTLDDCMDFRGSKYVQSDMGNCYALVINDLNDGKKVLFSGTPCQCEGLLRMLNGRHRENLIVADIICYGVPSPMLWQEYINYLEHKFSRGGTTKVLFRDKKSFGWHSHVAGIWFGSEKISNMAWADLFGKGVMLRPSCAKCRFSNLRRNSDITLGDCWGIEKVHPELDDNTGISLVVFHTAAGKNMMEELFQSQSIEWHVIDLKDFLQPRLQAPTVVDDALRTKFWHDYFSRGMEFVIHKYTRYSRSANIKSAIKRIIGTGGISAVRKLLGR